MTVLFPTTQPEAETVLIRLLWQAPRWGEPGMVDQLDQSVKLIALSGIRQRFPQES